MDEQDKQRLIDLSIRGTRARVALQRRERKLTKAAEAYAKAVIDIAEFDDEMKNKYGNPPLSMDEQVELTRQAAAEMGLDYDTAEEFQDFRRIVAKRRQADVQSTQNPNLN